jgi:NAD+ kinase
MKIAFFGNTYQKENLNLLESLVAMLKKRDVQVLFERGFYQFIEENMPFKLHTDELITDDNFTADLAVSVGGDGTFLRTAAHIGSKGTPIIGINNGRLGFLADIARTDVVEPFERILNKEFMIEERSLLQLDCLQGTPFMSYNCALNEVAVLKQDSSSMITIHTFINDQHLISYQADGLIVATPTGSTAYSMSVGGPLLVPTAKALVLTPIASHSLTVRPLVITDDCRIRLQVSSRTKSFLVSMDGRSQVLPEDMQLHIRKADYTIKVVKEKGHDYINTLKTKLMWGADKRLVASGELKVKN